MRSLFNWLLATLMAQTETFPDLPIVILANGKSTRFGSPKADAKLGSKTLLEIVHERVALQTSGPVIVNASQRYTTGFNADYIEDTIGSGLGPLAGIHASMSWARQKGYLSVATVSVDTPFVPINLITRLIEAGAAAHAVSRNRKHPTIGLWDVTTIELLERMLEREDYAAHRWLEQCQARSVIFEDANGMDPFFNINTAEDLEAARFLMKV